MSKEGEGAQPFFSALRARSEAVGSLLCVGLDPHSSDLKEDGNSAAGALAFCLRLIEATHSCAAAFKPNAAFFEVFGAAGAEALEKVVRAVPAGVPVVLDVKRGDISTTAEAYAAAAFDTVGAHCVTVNGYMGADGVVPFAERADRGVFVLCKTSNPSSNDLQTLQITGTFGSGGVGEFGAGKERLFEVVARLATSASAWNANGNVGLVVGATDASALRAARASATSAGSPEAWILAPGVGFQGGDLKAALAAGLAPSGFGMLLPVSRGISRAADPAEAARKLRDSINAARKEILAERAAVAAAASAAAAAAAAEPATVVNEPAPADAVAAPAAVAAEAATLEPHQRDFIRAALDARVLTFGSFTLKSGRVSPYFFNAGLFRTGKSIGALGRTYARAIRRSGVAFDVLFGPAYKGIPLVTAAAVALADGPDGVDVPVAYNRKEAKGHGEGGSMVGADVAGKRVLIVDDVISAGTAVGEAIAIIKEAGGEPAGVVIGLDRQERGGGDSVLSAVQQVQETYGVPVCAVATLRDLIAFVREAVAAGSTLSDLVGGGSEGLTIEALLDKVEEYRTTYGVSS